MHWEKKVSGDLESRRREEQKAQIILMIMVVS